MKQILKNIFYLLLTMLVFSACSDDDKSVPAPEIVGAQLISFGFYAEDNEFLDKDYLAGEGIVGNDIDIKIPSRIDKSKLIARFTTSADNPTVKVKGEVQVSGKTANNYNEPTDFVVSNTDKHNRKYTIRIKNPIEWIRTALFNDFEVMDAKIKINPIDDVPYVLVIKAGKDNERKTALLKYEDHKWSQVGDDISEGQSAVIDFTFDIVGTPYVVYQDFLNIVKKSASVSYFDGMSWVSIGRTFQDIDTNHNSICFAADGTLYVFSMNNGKKGVLPQRKLNISTYKQGVWTSNATIPGREQNSYIMRSVLKNNTVYLAVNDYANKVGEMKNSVSVYANDGTGWKTLGENMGHPEATIVWYNDQAIDVDIAGNVYVMTVEQFSTGYKLVIHNLLVESNTWTIYGTPIDLPTNSKSVSMKLDKQNFPAIFYNNATPDATFVTIDKDSRVWTSPYILPDILGNTGGVDIAFDSQGVGYSVYRNANNHVVLWQYVEDND